MGKCCYVPGTQVSPMATSQLIEMNALGFDGLDSDEEEIMKDAAEKIAAANGRYMY